MSAVDPPGEPHELSLELPAAHSAGRMARQMLRSFALGEGLPEDEVGTLEFVAGELLDNAVDHGGGGAAMDQEDLDADVRMSLAVRIFQAKWTVEVSDQGGADPQVMKDLLQPADGVPDLEDPRGRGFFLIQGMVDELSVEGSQDGAGLLVRATHTFGRD